MKFLPVSMLMIASSTITLLLSTYTWRRRNGATGTALFYLLAAITVWSLGYGMEVASSNMVQIKIFGAISYLGIATVPVLWFIFAACYTKHNSWFTPYRLALLFIVPAVSVTMYATNLAHYLFYSTEELCFSGAYCFVKTSPGLFFLLHITYSYLVVFWGIGLFVRMYYNVARSNRINIVFFIAGSLLPYVVNIAYVAGAKPIGFLDLTPLGFVCAGILLTVGVYSVNLFGINPLALDVLFDNIPDAILVVDTNKQIVSLNPSAQALFKIKDKPKIKDARRILKNIYPSVSSCAGNGNDTELKIDERFYLKNTQEIIDTKGEQLGTLLVLRDITERKNYEEVLKESGQQLRELNATKDKFFSIIAHDLRNPLNIVLGFSELLGENIREKNYDGIEEYSSFIKNSAERAMELLNNLMEWSRSQTGMIKFKAENIEIWTLVNEVVGLLKDNAGQKYISIKQEIPKDATVFADKAMFSTILRNLISNAIKFTHEGGKVLISARQHAKDMLISVADNGIGITKEILGKLFLLKENISTPGTKNEKGTGLGLLLCKEFVEKHGGKIWAESEEGKGSVFYFTLPIQKQEI